MFLIPLLHNKIFILDLSNPEGQKYQKKVIKKVIFEFAPKWRLTRLGMFSKCQIDRIFPWSVLRPLHRRKKGQIPAAFWPLFKNVTFEFSKYESFVIHNAKTQL